ncbi:unnamed protein product, partial [Leptidea sinapis]
MSAENKFFGPLTLHQKIQKDNIFKSDEPVEVQCVLCDSKYVLPTFEKDMLTHFFMEHRLVIADVSDIADLPGYVKYWKSRFKDNKPDGTKSKNEEYFLLSDVLPEDKELRLNLRQSKLESLLERHAYEREDKNYTKECLFCRYTSVGTRAMYLNHLYEKHNFHIAKPENLVFIDNLVDFISSKLEQLHCIYCEGIFKDRTILKEHMRKKGHKRINAQNKEYDKFFLVHYIGDKPTVKPNQHKKLSKPRTNVDNVSNVDSDPEWSEWTEENGPAITCLLCDHTETEYESILDHMERKHEFFFAKATAGMDFYQKVKIVNYIRRQIHLKQCLSCDTKFDDRINLEKHIKETNHWVLQRANWDQPEYYFPTYEDDLFLCFIQDDDESWWSSDDPEVDRENNLSDNISKEMAMAVLSD